MEKINLVLELNAKQFDDIKNALDSNGYDDEYFADELDEIFSKYLWGVQDYGEAEDIKEAHYRHAIIVSVKKILRALAIPMKNAIEATDINQNN